MNKLPLAEMTKVVAADLAKGKMGEATGMIISALERQPAIAVDLIESLIAESAKRRPNEDKFAGGMFMLGRALEIIQYAVEAGRAEEIALAERIRALLRAAHAKGRIDAGLLLLILNLFAAAKLDVGDDLRATMMQAMEETGDLDDPTEGDAADVLRDLLAVAGDDPFAVHTMLAETADVMPEGHQAVLATALLGEKSETSSSAALGFLLSSSVHVRKQVCQALAQMRAGDGAASPVVLRRMIALRNWLPAADRPDLDAAIKSLRQKSVECAPWSAPAKAEAYVSGFDGSGMQGIFVVVPDGKKSALAAMIGRLGMGVRDAWVRGGLSKREIKSMVGATNGQIGMTPVGLDYVGLAMRQFLAANVASNLMPPFGLLAFAEAAGISSMNPEATTAEDAIHRLVCEIEPARLTPDAVTNAVTASFVWPIRHRLFDSWFEEGDDIDRLLSGKQPARAKRVDAVLSGPVAANRQRWGEMLAWTAITAKRQPDGPDWREIAIVARELLGDRPIDNIPIARQIAEQTVEVHDAKAT